MAQHRPGQQRRRGDRRASGERRKGRRGRRKGDRSAISALFFLCLLAALALVAFLTFKTDFGAEIDWRKMLMLKDQRETRFKLGGVSLGMSPEEIRKKHPNLDMSGLGRGEIAASFRFEGAYYSVWFIDIDGRDTAYRMRYDQSFTNRTEADILDAIGEKYGKPGTSECSKAGEQARKCNFQWWPSGGIALNVSTSQAGSAAGKTRTEVTMIATDTYLDGKRMRLRNRPGGGITSPSQESSSEKLPL